MSALERGSVRSVDTGIGEYLQLQDVNVRQSATRLPPREPGGERIDGRGGTEEDQGLQETGDGRHGDGVIRQVPWTAILEQFQRKRGTGINPEQMSNQGQ